MAFLECILFIVLFMWGALATATAGEPFKDCEDCPQMVKIPAGTFEMGSSRFASEMPVRTVKVTKMFAIGKFEITFDDWANCVSAGGCQSNQFPADNNGGRGLRPVIYVTWDHVNEYINWLNSQVEGSPYRLPSEAEWEYAAQFGNKTGEHIAYGWGDHIDCSLASYGKRQGGECDVAPMSDIWRNQSVGNFPPNALGLYDMHGNVSEWVQDCWHPSYKERPSKTADTGAAWIEGDCIFRVVRGGSTTNPPENLRITNRSRLGQVNKGPNFGFRVVRNLP